MLLATKEIRVIETAQNTSRVYSLKTLSNFLNQRYKLSETNFATREALLTNHYNLFKLVSEVQTDMQKKNAAKPTAFNPKYNDDQIAEIWLQRCKVDRR